MVGYQIESRRIHKKVESHFLKIYEQKLNLENDLGKLEQRTNSYSDLMFMDIDKKVEEVLRASNFNFKNLNPTQADLQQMFQLLNNVERNIDNFDETFTTLRAELAAKLSENAPTFKSYITLTDDLVSFTPENVWSKDRFEMGLKILSKVTKFQAMLVSL